MHHKIVEFLPSILILPCLLLLLSNGQAGEKPNQDKTVLRVALFPYIPDSLNDNFAALLHRIEREFETTNPTVDLRLRALNKNDDFYDKEQLKSWLSSESGENGYDVIEVDGLLLGDLISDNLIKEWSNSLNIKDWHQAGYQAVRRDGKIYGVPHLLCGHFIFSRSRSIAKAKSVERLLQALAKADPQIPNVIADLDGSWNLPAIYLDAWVDTHSPDNVTSALTPTLDSTVMPRFKLFSRECAIDNKNPCVDGTFHDNDLGAQRFAAKQADAFLGYSERLNIILRSGGTSNEIYLSSAPLGSRKTPLLFVDAFVMRRACNDKCQEAARRFADYMNSPETFEWYLMSRDSTNAAIPRYLLPATKSAFKTPLVKQDPFFKQLKRQIKGGIAYPNNGFPAVRREMKTAIQTQLAQ